MKTYEYWWIADGVQAPKARVRAEGPIAAAQKILDEKGEVGDLVRLRSGDVCVYTLVDEGRTLARFEEV